MSGKILALAYLVASAANVSGAWWTKPLLMPLLLAWAVSLLHHWKSARIDQDPVTFTPWLFSALAFSWLGDLALMGESETWFLLGIGAFAGAQISYIVMFSKLPGPGLVLAWKFLLVPYLIFWIFFNSIIEAGNLRVPVLIYSALLTAMAISALNAALRLQKPWRFLPNYGALLFVASDSLIALAEFNGVSINSGAIMITYLAGQSMLVAGIVLSQAPTGSLSRKR
jgi:uncharacterized membrane protein YhhN